MPFPRPTRSELLNLARTELETRLPGSDARLRRSFLDTIARIFAAGVHAMFGFLVFVARQAFATTADEEALRQWGALYGVNENPASFGAGLVVFDGSDLAEIPEGTIVRRADAVEFRTLELGVISAGSATVPVISVLPGSTVNTDPGVKLTMLSPVPGVAATGTVDADGITGGTDVENIESLRARIVARIRRPPAGGTIADYIARAKECPGVTDVFVNAPLVDTSVAVSIGSQTVDAEVNGHWSAKGVSRTVKVIVAFESNALANGETVTLTLNLQDATDIAGTAAADFGSVVGPVVLATAVGAVAVYGQHEVDVDILTARAFLRAQATLATSAAGTMKGWTVTLQYQGGPGEVGVAALFYDRADPIPTSADLITIQGLLDAPEFKTIWAQSIAYALEPVEQDLTIELDPDTPALRLAVETDVNDRFRREAVPGGVIPISHIRETISLAAGESDHVLTGISGDVDLGGDVTKISVLGTITWV